MAAVVAVETAREMAVMGVQVAVGMAVVVEEVQQQVHVQVILAEL